MDFVTTVTEKLQKYEVTSSEEAITVFGEMWQVTQLGPGLNARAGFGRDGFNENEGLELELPDRKTLLSKHGGRAALLQGLNIANLARSYSKFFNDMASVLLLKNVALDPQKRTLYATVTLDFSLATHVLLIQPLCKVRCKVPRKLRRKAIFNIQRELEADYRVQYVALPIAYHEEYISNFSVLRDHREYQYIQYLINNFKMVEPRVGEDGVENPDEEIFPNVEQDTEEKIEQNAGLDTGQDTLVINRQDVVGSDSEGRASGSVTRVLTKKTVSLYREIWNLDYGELTGESQKLLHYESPYGRELNYVLLPDGRLLNPHQVESKNSFADATVSETQIWNVAPSKAAVLKFYSACWGQICVYDFIQHPQGNIYTERMLFTLAMLEQELSKDLTMYGAETAEAEETEEMTEETEVAESAKETRVGFNPNEVSVVKSPTWTEQIMNKTAFQEFVEEFGQGLDEED